MTLHSAPNYTKPINLIMKKLFRTAVLLLLIIGLAIKTQAQTNSTPQSLPYSQNFSSFTKPSIVYPAGLQGWGFGSTAISNSFNISAPTADQAITEATNATSSDFVGDMKGKLVFWQQKLISNQFAWQSALLL